MNENVQLKKQIQHLTEFADNQNKQSNKLQTFQEGVLQQQEKQISELIEKLGQYQINDSKLQHESKMIKLRATELEDEIEKRTQIQNQQQLIVSELEKKCMQLQQIRNECQEKLSQHNSYQSQQLEQQKYFQNQLQEKDDIILELKDILLSQQVSFQQQIQELKQEMNNLSQNDYKQMLDANLINNLSDELQKYKTLYNQEKLWSKQLELQNRHN